MHNNFLEDLPSFKLADEKKTNTVIIDLSDNMIEIFDLAELVPFKNLNELILSGNKLKGFYFRNESNRNFTCKYLKKLDLSLNLIEDVDLNFEIFKYLEYLDLSSNSIKYFHDSHIKLLKNLKSIKLNNNKLVGI